MDKSVEGRTKSWSPSYHKRDSRLRSLIHVVCVHWLHLTWFHFRLQLWLKRNEMEIEMEIEIEIELKFLQRAMRLTTSRRSSLSVFSVILVFGFWHFWLGFFGYSSCTAKMLYGQAQLCTINTFRQLELKQASLGDYIIYCISSSNSTFIWVMHGYSVPREVEQVFFR